MGAALPFASPLCVLVDTHTHTLYTEQCQPNFKRSLSQRVLGPSDAFKMATMAAIGSPCHRLQFARDLGSPLSTQTQFQVHAHGQESERLNVSSQTQLSISSW